MHLILAINHKLRTITVSQMVVQDKQLAIGMLLLRKNLPETSILPKWFEIFLPNPAILIFSFTSRLRHWQLEWSVLAVLILIALLLSPEPSCQPGRNK